MLLSVPFDVGLIRLPSWGRSWLMGSLIHICGDGVWDCCQRTLCDGVGPRVCVVIGGEAVGQDVHRVYGVCITAQGSPLTTSFSTKDSPLCRRLTANRRCLTANHRLFAANGWQLMARFYSFNTDCG